MSDLISDVDPFAGLNRTIALRSFLEEVAKEILDSRGPLEVSLRELVDVSEQLDLLNPVDDVLAILSPLMKAGEEIRTSGLNDLITTRRNAVAEKQTDPSDVPGFVAWCLLAEAAQDRVEGILKILKDTRFLDGELICQTVGMFHQIGAGILVEWSKRNITDLRARFLGKLGELKLMQGEFEDWVDSRDSKLTSRARDLAEHLIFDEPPAWLGFPDDCSDGEDELSVLSKFEEGSEFIETRTAVRHPLPEQPGKEPVSQPSAKKRLRPQAETDALVASFFKQSETKGIDPSTLTILSIKKATKCSTGAIFKSGPYQAIRKNRGEQQPGAPRTVATDPAQLEGRSRSSLALAQDLAKAQSDEIDSRIDEEDRQQELAKLIAEQGEDDRSWRVSSESRDRSRRS
jgi:hypothetical protein